VSLAAILLRRQKSTQQHLPISLALMFDLDLKPVERRVRAYVRNVGLFAVFKMTTADLKLILTFRQQAQTCGA
jgi:hypothetical protein